LMLSSYVNLSQTVGLNAWHGGEDSLQRVAGDLSFDELAVASGGRTLGGVGSVDQQAAVGDGDDVGRFAWRQVGVKAVVGSRGQGDQSAIAPRGVFVDVDEDIAQRQAVDAR